jgi:hypothetical protein
MTWLWAPDEVSARQVREITAGKAVYQKGLQLPLVTDIDIGVVAYESCQALIASGYTFTWHDSQHPLNRAGWPTQLPGMPDAGN